MVHVLHKIYSIQHYVIKFVVNDLQQGRWFSPVSSTSKTDRHDIAEILLKVVLNTITPPVLHKKCLIRYVNSTK